MITVENLLSLTSDMFVEGEVRVGSIVEFRKIVEAAYLHPGLVMAIEEGLATVSWMLNQNGYGVSSILVSRLMILNPLLQEMFDAS